jgi:hypothetical protein
MIVLVLRGELSHERLSRVNTKGCPKRLGYNTGLFNKALSHSLCKSSIKMYFMHTLDAPHRKGSLLRAPCRFLLTQCKPTQILLSRASESSRTISLHLETTTKMWFVCSKKAESPFRVFTSKKRGKLRRDAVGHSSRAKRYSEGHFVL